GSPLEMGSDWLFAKLYCSPSHADRLLLELVQPLAADVMSAGLADRWFFLRYGDPNWHLRLRFHGNPALLNLHVLPRLRQLAEDHQRQGTLWRLQFDAYEREVERYGGPLAIGVAEHLFQLDSELCLDLLQLISDLGDADLRWQLACCGVDRLLSALGLALEEKEFVARNMARAREQQFVIDQDYKQQMAQTFRVHRQTLSALITEGEAGKTVAHAADSSKPAIIPEKAFAALERYSARLQTIRGQMENLQNAKELGQPIPDIAASFVHMHLNRMFRSRHHEQEAVVCDLLSRTYASMLARRAGAAPIPQ
ncbi:MAG: thiopeptide-type bacteriocin biosynthesis protein, partial [Terriglobales bacterium]